MGFYFLVQNTRAIHAMGKNPLAKCCCQGLVCVSNLRALLYKAGRLLSSGKDLKCPTEVNFDTNDSRARGRGKVRTHVDMPLLKRNVSWRVPACVSGCCSSSASLPWPIKVQKFKVHLPGSRGYWHTLLHKHKCLLKCS